MKNLILVAIAALLLSPCPACEPKHGGGAPEPCVEFVCGDYEMDGNYLTTLHTTIYEQNPEGELELYDERIGDAWLRIGSTGSAASINGIPCEAHDDRLLCHADMPVIYDRAAAYRDEFAYRGECSLEGECRMDVEVTVIAGSARAYFVAYLEWSDLVKVEW